MNFLHIKQIVGDRFKANSYIFMEDSQCIVIDCNTNTLPYLQKNNLEPVYLFVTHEHFDHVDGVKKLKECFPNMVIVASKITSSLMKDAKTNMSFYLDGIGIEEIEADVYIEDKSSFLFKENNIQTYYTPGHTAGGIIIHINNYLFTGDTLLDIKTPTNLPNSSRQQLKESLDFIDNYFDNNTIFYQGHGEPFLKKDWDKDISVGIKKIKK